MRTTEGITWVARQSTADSSYYWEVRLFGDLLHSGTSVDRKAARAALEKHLGATMLKTEEKRASKNAIAMKLKRYMKTRPYVFVHVLSAIISGYPMEDAIAEAAVEERRRHDEDKKKAGHAWPIPTHHSALEADEIARRIFAAAELYGLKGKKALKYGKRYFGKSFAGADEASVIAEAEAAALRAQKEDDAR